MLSFTAIWVNVNERIVFDEGHMLYRSLYGI